MKLTNAQRRLTGNVAGYFILVSSLFSAGLWFHAPITLLLTAVIAACVILYKFSDCTAVFWINGIWISILIATILTLGEVVLPNVGRPDFSLIQALKNSIYLTGILLFFPYATIISVSGWIRSLLIGQR